MADSSESAWRAKRMDAAWLHVPIVPSSQPASLSALIPMVAHLTDLQSERTGGIARTIAFSMKVHFTLPSTQL
jgi:hypothetical protein